MELLIGWKLIAMEMKIVKKMSRMQLSMKLYSKSNMKKPKKRMKDKKMN